MPYSDAKPAPEEGAKRKRGISDREREGRPKPNTVDTPPFQREHSIKMAPPPTGKHRFATNQMEMGLTIVERVQKRLVANR
jgi:hypothetical protein